jgi:hypothetical protein
VVRDYPPDTKNYADPVTPGSRLYPDLRSSSEKAVKDAFPRLATALA